MRYADVHTHPHFDAFDADRKEVLDRAQSAGVSMLAVGTNLEASRKAVALAESEEGVFATVGLHPVSTEPFVEAAFAELAASPKVVGIGECGLDYFRLIEESRPRQKELFIAQIAFANQVGKPLMLHIRDAYKDAHELLRAHAKVGGNVHFFAGSWEEAKLFLDLGFTLSFTGVLTFTSDYDETVRNAPLDRLLSETDAPYVAPVPYRGTRNEPAHVVEVVKRIALIRGEDEEVVREALAANAARAFGLS